jgi:cell division protein FtsI (penicillin-binding protein 3)
MSSKNHEYLRVRKTFSVILLILFAFSLLVFSLTNTATSERDLPSLLTVKKELAVRGNIYSADNFKIGTSRKIFSASIDTRSLDKNKIDLFATLFSIYSNMDKQEILKKIKSKKGFLILSRTIDQRSAKNLKSLGFKLLQLDVFQKIKIRGNEYLYGLDIYETGEDRIYPYNDALTPVIGFMKKDNKTTGKQRVNGVNGLEKQFNSYLNNMQDGILKGEKDILSYIIFNKDSQIIKREDGQDIQLTIPLKLQRNIELMVDRYKEKLEAKEIIVSVMESQTGKIIALASSNRYDPTSIQQDQIEYLRVNAIEYNFEPGSVIKPIALALALDINKVNETELFNAHNKGKVNKKGEYPRGRYKIGRFTIGDDHQFTKRYITLKDIFIYSSNIGTLMVANRLTAEEFYNGYLSFGLSQKTGIDLPHEATGVIHKLYQYKAGEDEGKDNIFKATDSYGQGITTTFMQVMKAYSVFNNNGVISTPYIVNKSRANETKQIIQAQTANKIKEFLIATVNEGTGTLAKIDGIIIGGKTGTAQIARGGSYQKRYISSFFGIANDHRGKKYTVGVTVREPVAFGKYWYYRYASHSAVPVFRETAKILIKLGYLDQLSTEKSQ